VERSGIQSGDRVLVTGATGFTGRVLTRKLCERGAEVVAIARPSSDLEPLADCHIQWLLGDVADPDLVAKAAQNVHYVFHMATAYREARSSPDVYHRVHVSSTQHLARAVLDNDSFKRFVHVSTIGVHGHIEGAPADETHPFRPGDEYQATKAEAEKWIADFARESGMPYTIVRPAGIYGPGDHRLLKFFRMAAGGNVLMLGSGAGDYHLVHVEDLTDMMLQLATHPDADGEAFICGARDATTLAEIARIVGVELNRRVRIIRLPAWPFFIAAALCEGICKPLRIEPPLYRRRVAFFTKDRKFDTSKVFRTLDYAPVHPVENGIRQTTRWYVNQGWISA
jgi:nucleoside-diphosphate-sugar epimerase